MSTVDVHQQNFDFGRVVGQTFGLIGRNFVIFLLLGVLFSAVPNAALLAYQTYALTNAMGLPDPGALAWISVGSAVVTVICTVVLQGALTRAAIDDLSGRGATLGGALGAGFRLILPLIGLAILMGLGQMFGLILLIVPGLILIVRWVVAAPVLVTEETGVTSAMGRSADLTRGHRWAIFGLLALYFVIAFGGGAAIGGVTTSMTMSAAIDYTTLLYASSAVQVVLELVVDLIGAAGAASIYIELRRVNEGAGVDELANIFA